MGRWLRAGFRTSTGALKGTAGHVYDPTPSTTYLTKQFLPRLADDVKAALLSNRPFLGRTRRAPVLAFLIQPVPSGELLTVLQGR